jgi:Cu+-exporting ATPase
VIVRKRRLGVAAALAAGLWVHVPLDLSHYSAWLISLPLVCWCAWPFHAGALEGFRRGRANADMLVSLSVLAAFTYTTVIQFVPEAVPVELRFPLFGTMAALVLFPLAGRWLELLLTEGSGESIWRLMRRIPATARLVDGGKERLVPSEEVPVGAELRVPAGEPIPLDGEVIRGSSRVDESLWTGSDEPAEKTLGSRVLGGAINKDADLGVRVTRGREGSDLFRLVGLVGEGFKSKGPSENLADRLSRGYVPVVVIAAATAALIWSWRGGATRIPDAMAAFTFTIAAACPWALAWAAPAALLLGIRRAGRLGMRIRNSGALQTLDRPDVLIVNKTGFLTVGRPRLVEARCFGDWTEKSLLPLAAAAGWRSGHPYAGALRHQHAREDERAVEEVDVEPGRGASARIDGRRVLVGSLIWLRGHGIEPEEDVYADLQRRSEPLLAVAVDGALAGLLFFSDPLREDIPQQLRRLESLGLEVVLASADRNAAVHAAAAEVGIKRAYAEVQEEDKVRIVRELQSSGKRVAMVGEGVHDAPALSLADLGVALESRYRSGAGPAARPHFDLAAEAADLVLEARDLDGLTRSIQLAIMLRKVIRENLMWAFVPTMLLLPVAAGALRPGFETAYSPQYASIVALASGVAIIVNSLRRLKV